MRDIETLNRRIDYLTSELSRVKNPDLRSIMTTERNALDYAVEQIEKVIEAELQTHKYSIADGVYDEALTWGLT